MRHITARARVARPVRALLAAVLVMAVGVAPGAVAEPTTDQPAEEAAVAPELTDTDLDVSADNATEPETSAASPTRPTATTQSSAPAPLDVNSLLPGALAQDGVTVERKGDVDTVHIHDPEGELWQWGGKASDENIFAVTREGKVAEVLSVTADGRELERTQFGWVNTQGAAFIGFDLNALHTVPPVDVTIKVKADTQGEYDIAEGKDIPSSAEFAKSGFGPKEEIDPEVDAQLRAGSVATVPGWPDKELKVDGLNTQWVGGNPELTFKVNGPDDGYRLTRFAVKKVKNDSNTKGIEGPVTIRVIRDGRDVLSKTYNFTTVGVGANPDFLNQRFWNLNAKGNSYDTEFRLVPEVDDLKIKSGDTLELSFTGPPNGQYAVQVWGQGYAAPTTADKFRLEGEGVLVKDLGVTGENPFVSTGEFLQDSNFERAYVRVRAPNSPLAIERYDVTVDRIEDGVKLEKRVISATADEVVYEVFPVSASTGKRLPSAKVPKGAKIAATAKYPSRPRAIESTVTVFGSPVENAPKPTIPKEAPKGELISSAYPNPPMPKKCGLKVAIVADLSTSLSYADYNGFDASKSAAKQLAKSLQGTPTEVGIYSFADRAANNSGGPQPVDGPNGELNPQITSAIDSWKSGSVGGATNWEAALKQVQDNKYDVVYFITDGMPTSDNSNWQNSLIEKDRNGFNFGAFVQETSLNRAVIAADELKSQGTRIVPLMVDLRLGNNREFLVERDYVLKDLKTFEESKEGQYSFYAASGKQASLGSTARYPSSETLVNVEEALKRSTTDIKLFRFLQNRKDGREKNGKYRDVNANSAHYLDTKWGIENLTHGLRTVKSMGEDISGPNDTVRLNSYGQLAGELKKLGEEISQMCEGKVIVKKQIVDASGKPLHNNVKDWEFSIASNAPVIGLPDGRTRFADKQLTSVKADGGTSEGNVPDDHANVVWPIHSERPVEVAIAETQQEPYRLYQRDGKNAVCTQKLKGEEAKDADVKNDGETGFKVGIPATKDGHLATVTCTVSNTKDVEEMVRLQLQKVDASDTATALKGAKFEVRDTPTGPAKLPVEWDESSKSYKTEAQLVPGTEYYLVETQSPLAEDGQRYALLTAPVRFKIVNDERGYVVQVARGDTWASELADAGLWTKRPDQPADATAYLQVANVRQGNLPKTGGYGLQVPLLLSSVLILFGAALGRRNMTRA